MFNLRNYNTVYYPAKSNEPLNILIDYNLDDEDDYPVKLNRYPGTFTLDGLEFISDENPSIYPATIEWNNKLKAVYPDLQPYVPDYNNVIKSILANTKTVVCRKSYVNHVEAIESGALVFVNADTKLFKNTYYVAVNPFTLEVCNSDADYFAMPNINIPF